MAEKIEWVSLQQSLDKLLDKAQVRKFEDVMEKDPNGWNWILSFHDLRTAESVVIHTKFIFKLTDDKKNLRKNEFLYLKEMNCIYDIIKFDSLIELNSSINEILMQNLFGKNIVSLSEFLIEPERTINASFEEKKLSGYTIFEFEYYPKQAMVACQKAKYEFKFNVNNDQDVEMIIKKESKSTFKFLFKTGGKTYNIEQPNLDNISDTIATFIQKYLNKD